MRNVEEMVELKKKKSPFAAISIKTRIINLQARIINRCDI